MSWFSKLMPSRIRTEGGNKRNVPEGLWTKCGACGAVLYRPELERNLQVCPKCGDHMRLSARTRLDQFLDPEPRREIARDLEPIDVLRFRDSKKYRDRIVASQKKRGNCTGAPSFTVKTIDCIQRIFQPTRSRIRSVPNCLVSTPSPLDKILTAWDSFPSTIISRSTASGELSKQLTKISRGTRSGFATIIG